MTSTNEQKPPTVADPIAAARLDGAVHDQAHADLGRNRSGERVVRLDLQYTRGTAPCTTTMILTQDAAIALRNQLDGLLDPVQSRRDLARRLVQKWRRHGRLNPASSKPLARARGEQVDPADACPNCGERCQDLLVWFDNADQVGCEACGHVYAPPRAAATAGQPRSDPRGW